MMYNPLICLDLKPENLLYLSKADDSPLVLADFGIAKMLDSKDEVLTTMAGSFGYAAPEIMLKKGHGKAVDMWSLGVITYTLLCGYSPFRSENLPDLIAETTSGQVVFHDRYWKDVSKDAKNFILRLLKVRPDDRPTSDEALKDVWLTGETATDHNILPELRSFMARSRLRHGIEVIKLAKRIEALKMIEDDDDNENDIPDDAVEQAGQALLHPSSQIGLATTSSAGHSTGKKISRAARSAIFREVVLAKVREMKAEEERKATEKALTQ